MMEKLMENDGAINGQWRKIKGTWWKKWKMTEDEWNMMEKLMEHVRKLMEHDGTTNVTWKKTNGKSRKRTRTWKKTNRKLKTAKNKNNNKSWKKTSPYLISLFKVFKAVQLEYFFHSPVANNQPLFTLLAW